MYPIALAILILTRRIYKFSSPSIEKYAYIYIYFFFSLSRSRDTVRDEKETCLFSEREPLSHREIFQYYNFPIKSGPAASNRSPVCSVLIRYRSVGSFKIEWSRRPDICESIDFRSARPRRRAGSSPRLRPITVAEGGGSAGIRGEEGGREREGGRGRGRVVVVRSGAPRVILRRRSPRYRHCYPAWPQPLNRVVNPPPPSSSSCPLPPPPPSSHSPRVQLYPSTGV